MAPEDGVAADLPPVDGTPEDLGPYPRAGTPEEKLAWAKADTARRTDQWEVAQADAEQVDADGWGDRTGWWGEDKTVPRLIVEVLKSGDVRSRVDPAWLQEQGLSPAPPPPTRARAPRARRRTRSTPPRGDPDSDEPPLPDLARLLTGRRA